MGTGSGAAIASQFVTGLSRITRQNAWPGIKAINLTDPYIFLSKYGEEEDQLPAILNQLENWLDRGDVFLVIAAGVHSRIAIRCIEIANRRGATTIGFTGEDGNRLAALVDVGVQIPSSEPEYLENLFQVLGNLIACVLKDEALSVSGERWKGQELTRQASTIRPALARKSSVDLPATGHITERSRASLEMFSEISRELAYQKSLRDLLRRILELTLDRLRASSGTIVILNEQGDPVEGAIAYDGEVITSVPQQYSDIVSRGLAGWVLKNRKAALIANTRDDPRWLARPWEGESENARSAICVPLMEDERVIGVMTLVSRQVGVFSEDDLSLLAAFAMFITLVNYAL
jgi:phosphoheptose isomerase